MKKISLFLLTFLLVFLVSCNLDTTTTAGETSTNTTTAETTESTYDDRSLVTDLCSHLDNIDDWQPVWCDEFDYEGLPNSELWSYDVGGSGWGNGESQYYTDADIDNAYVSDGTLKIQAIREDYMGMDYTSARLITKYKGDWLYGKIQVRAKMPSGTGTWPAIWMLPTDWSYGSWPNSGEIDIMEHVGYEPEEIYGTIHTAAYNHSLNTQIGYSQTVEDCEEEFHVYEIEWEPSVIRIYIDGSLYGTFGYNPLTNVDIDNTDAWPFDQRFHLLLNVAVGGSWGGAQGIDDDIFPTAMEVDYVRVYQKDYAGMDTEEPTAVEDLTVMYSKQSEIKITWDKANDDIMVKEYEIYLDSTLVGTTSLNAFKVDDLDPNTMYNIAVLAVDFAGNRSDIAELNTSTDAVESILSGIVEAEDYDFASGIYVETTEDDGGGQNIGYIDAGDYLEYTLYVEEAGTYTITYRIASESVAGEIKLYGLSALPIATTPLPITGGWQIWTDVTSDTFTLSEGVYTFKIRASIGGFNLNYFEFKKVE